jgi:topoisomerase IV subunit A
MLRLHVELLQQYLKAELEFDEKECLQAVFEKTLEQIFIEKKLYKHIEEVESYDEVYGVLEKCFKPYLKLLERVPEKEDFDRLLAIPIRRIGRFDVVKNQEDIKAIHEKLDKIRGHLKKLKAYTIAYLNGLIEKYGENYPRRTKVRRMEEVDKRAIETKEVEVGFDSKTGYLGTKVEGKLSIRCTNFDKLLLLYKSGNFKIINIPEKQYVGQEKDEVVHVGIADKQTLFSCCYKDPESGLSFAKRFIVKQFILEKNYRFLDEGMKLQFISTKPEVKLLISFVPKSKQKMAAIQFNFAEVLVKGVEAKGVRIATRPVLEVKEFTSK